MIAEQVAKLVSRFEALKGTGTVVRIDHAFSALSGDIIVRVCCEDYSEFLQDSEFSADWYAVMALWQLLLIHISGSIYFTAWYGPCLYSWDSPSLSSMYALAETLVCCIGSQLGKPLTVSSIVSLIPEAFLEWFDPRILPWNNFKKVHPSLQAGYC